MTAPAGWVDSHCHVHGEADAGEQIERARAAGVRRFVCVGTDLATSQAAVALAAEHDDVHASVGLHPHDASKLADEWPAIADLAASAHVVAIGEAGFDFHYMHSPADAQEEAFRAQIGLAHETGKTLVIHTREAWPDTFRVLDDAGVPDRTVFHCFTGGPAEAEAALRLGAWLSFSGIVTFGGADEVRAAARLVPGDRLLVETDSPYLAPTPHRGRPNEPAYVAHVGAGLAEARGESADDVARATTAAAQAAFRI